MKIFSVALKASILLSGVLFVFSACASRAENRSGAADVSTTVSGEPNDRIQIPVNSNRENSNSAAPQPPDTQAEILDENGKTTNSEIGSFDFRNYIYPLPRGWQDDDGAEAILEDGGRRMEEKRIGLSYVTTRYGDVTDDGIDEAFVILKIVTAGSAIPQIVYVFTWKDEKPALIWHFRTGDRADGGLKNIYADDGNLVIEIFGQDRYILGGVETMKITGDEEQLCCPTHWTRASYKWNGNDFRMQGKRLTFSVADKNAPPVENKNEILEKQKNVKK
ncbi:MAG TPA: hypothetical protein VF721_23635 [Pyrinomonadaceae bacterium]|jgi:hypothetical protein